MKATNLPSSYLQGGEKSGTVRVRNLRADKDLVVSSPTGGGFTQVIRDKEL